MHIPAKAGSSSSRINLLKLNRQNLCKIRLLDICRTLNPARFSPISMGLTKSTHKKLHIDYFDQTASPFTDEQSILETIYVNCLSFFCCSKKNTYKHKHPICGSLKCQTFIHSLKLSFLFAMNRRYKKLIMYHMSTSAVVCIYSLCETFNRFGDVKVKVSLVLRLSDGTFCKVSCKLIWTPKKLW